MEEQELKHALEAIKLMGDWSKWLVTLNTATLAVLSFLLGSGGYPNLNEGAIRWLIAIALVLFFLSILFATFLLYKLPAAVQELLRSPAGADVYHLGGTSDGQGWTTGALVWWQQVLFLGGLFFILLTIVLRVLGY